MSVEKLASQLSQKGVEMKELRDSGEIIGVVAIVGILHVHILLF